MGCSQYGRYQTLLHCYKNVLDERILVRFARPFIGRNVCKRALATLAALAPLRPAAQQVACMSAIQCNTQDACTLVSSCVRIEHPSWCIVSESVVAHIIQIRRMSHLPAVPAPGFYSVDRTFTIDVVCLISADTCDKYSRRYRRIEQESRMDTRYLRLFN